MADSRKAAMSALDAIEEDASLGSFGDRLPEGKRPKLILTIEMGEPEEEELEEDELEEIPSEEF